MTTTNNTKRASTGSTPHLLLATLLALATGGCGDGTSGLEGLRIPSGGIGTQSEADAPEGQQRNGMWLAPAPVAAAPASEPVIDLATTESEQTALQPTSEPADVVNVADGSADDNDEDKGSSASRTGAETAQVAAQSFSMGDPLEFGTHTQLAPIGLVGAANGTSTPFFGSPVLVQGDRMLVGAWGDGEQANEQGAVFVFERDMSGVWSQDIKLMASDADEEPLGDTYGASFGYKIAMDGDTLAVGAAWDDGGADKLEAGAVYVYELVSNAWVETKLVAPSPKANETFGDALQVSGDWLFVHGRDVAQNQIVYVFHRVDGTWLEEPSQIITSPDAGEQLEFGTSLAAGGTTLFVQAHSAPGGTTTWSDTKYSVYVYELSAGTWSQTDELVASDSALGSGFGTLAFDGSTLIVGAPYFTGTEAYQGKAYAFENIAGSWQQTAEKFADSPRAFGYFGYNVTVDGDSFAVATGYGDENDAVDVYERTVADGWILNQSVVVSEVVASHSVAPSVSLFGGQLFLGLPVAQTAGSSVGAVYALTGAL